jgi:chromosome partitioning protein
MCDPIGMTALATASSGANARATDSYVVALMNQKGGVGKTMLTLSLAQHTAAANGRALVVDVDPQSNAYDLTGVMTEPGYDVTLELDPAELTRIRQLRNYDSIFVDCPGSLEGSDVLAQVLARSTFVLIPFPNQPETLLPTLRTARKVQESGTPYAVVVTKADPRFGPDWVEDAWRTLEGEGIRHFRSFIREYRAWPNSLAAGVPITRWSERHSPKVREDVARLHAELLLAIGRLAPAGRS